MQIPDYNGTGVYLVRNQSNGKVYVGVSTNVRRRLKQHFNALAMGKHQITNMQNDYSYGDTFSCEVIYKYNGHSEILYEKARLQEYDLISEMQASEKSYNRSAVPPRRFWTRQKEPKQIVNIDKTIALLKKRIGNLRLCDKKDASTASKLCALLNCQLGDITEYVYDNNK